MPKRKRPYNYRLKKELDRRKTATIVLVVLFFVLGYFVALQSSIYKPELVPRHHEFEKLKASEPRTAYANLVAVSSSNSSGILGNVSIEIVPGSGRVLMNTNPFLETDTQFSAEIAVSVAEKYTRKSLENNDVIISFGLPARVLGGPSAGAAIAVATIAAIEEKYVDPRSVITGKIEATGEISPVGSVIEKATAAAQNNVKKFLVPVSQENVIYYEKEYRMVEKTPGKYSRKVVYTPRELKLNTYTQKQWNMTTIGVADVAETVITMVK